MGSWKGILRFKDFYAQEAMTAYLKIYPAEDWVLRPIKT